MLSPCPSETSFTNRKCRPNYEPAIPSLKRTSEFRYRSDQRCHIVGHIARAAHRHHKGTGDCFRYLDRSLAAPPLDGMVGGSSRLRASVWRRQYRPVRHLFCRHGAEAVSSGQIGTIDNSVSNNTKNIARKKLARPCLRKRRGSLEGAIWRTSTGNRFLLSAHHAKRRDFAAWGSAAAAFAGLRFICSAALARD
jgi:hypothetical protein